MYITPSQNVRNIQKLFNFKGTYVPLICPRYVPPTICHQIEANNILATLNKPQTLIHFRFFNITKIIIMNVQMNVCIT